MYSICITCLCIVCVLYVYYVVLGCGVRVRMGSQQFPACDSCLWARVVLTHGKRWLKETSSSYQHILKCFVCNLCSPTHSLHFRMCFGAMWHVLCWCAVKSSKNKLKDLILCIRRLAVGNITKYCASVILFDLYQYFHSYGCSHINFIFIGIWSFTTLHDAEDVPNLIWKSCLQWHVLRHYYRCWRLRR